eukprot:361860-Chlamydomonas_euryale.AAC.2
MTRNDAAPLSGFVTHAIFCHLLLLTLCAGAARLRMVSARAASGATRAVSRRSMPLGWCTQVVRGGRHDATRLPRFHLALGDCRPCPSRPLVLFPCHIVLACRLSACHIALACRLKARHIVLACRLSACHIVLACRLSACHIALACRLSACHIALACRLSACHIVVACRLSACYIAARAGALSATLSAAGTSALDTSVHENGQSNAWLSATAASHQVGLSVFLNANILSASPSSGRICSECVWSVLHAVTYIGCGCGGCGRCGGMAPP